MLGFLMNLKGLFDKVAGLVGVRGFKKFFHVEGLYREFYDEMRTAPYLKHCKEYGVTPDQAKAYHDFCVATKRMPVFRKIAENLPDGNAEILDLGSGIGHITSLAADLIPKARITGVEISEAGLQIAREKYSRPNIEYRRGDATHLEFADNSFDAVYSCATLEHVNNPGNMLREAIRVCRPTGICIIAAPTYRHAHFWDFPHPEIREHSLLQRIVPLPYEEIRLSDTVRLYDIVKAVGNHIVEYQTIGFQPPRDFFYYKEAFDPLFGELLQFFKELEDVTIRSRMSHILHFHMITLTKSTSARKTPFPQNTICTEELPSNLKTCIFAVWEHNCAKYDVRNEVLRTLPLDPLYSEFILSFSQGKTWREKLLALLRPR